MVALAVIPSASVALVVTRSATLGVLNGFAVCVGIVLGDLILIIFALLGLSVVAHTMGSLFVVIKVLGGVYLLWFGFSLLRVKTLTKIESENTKSKSNFLVGFFAGFFLTLGDIKAILFYASLLPLFIDLSLIQVSEIVMILVITIFSVGGVKVIYAIFANKLLSYVKNSNVKDILRKIVGSFMMGLGSYLLIKI
ncbi:MAG: LysE family translocator [Arcobacteraceae bacterium]|nr:LysE family translocator [Arcobacteraceae bacterium]